jgi:hypothetical protein
VWRPAVRLVIACSGGTDTARRALRPVPRGARCTRCGGNAAAGSAEPEPKNRHGGAPRGERPALWDARRLASAWHAASSHAQRVLSAASVRLSALRPPLIGLGTKFTTRAQSRRGNVLGCLTSEDVKAVLAERMRPRSASALDRPHAEEGRSAGQHIGFNTFGSAAIRLEAWGRPHPSRRAHVRLRLRPHLAARSSG